MTAHAAAADDWQLPTAMPASSVAAESPHYYPTTPVSGSPSPTAINPGPLPERSPYSPQRLPAGNTPGSPVYESPVYGTDTLPGVPGAPAATGEGHDGVAGQAGQPWQWHLLPQGLLYHSYLAGGREPRFSGEIYYNQHEGWMFDGTAGARVGVLRYGTDDMLRPKGWELDAEAAAFPRLTFDEYRDLVSVDFRYGFPLTYRRGPWEVKFAFYHLSSHLADEYMLTGRPYNRLNFVRDAFVLGIAYWPTEWLRLYVEPDWAFHVDGGAEPWQIQFGLDFSPPYPTGCHGGPFLAVNGRLRQEVDFGGGFTLQTGWAWRSRRGQLLRFGLHYFNGQSEQCQFYREHEQQIGLGLWYDF